MVNNSWKNVTLSQIGTFQKGSGISRAESNSGVLPAVRYGELYTVHNNYVRTYTSHISREVANKALRVHYGDVLFACSGETKEDIAKCAAIIDNSEVYAGGDIIVLSPTTEVDPIFLGFILNTPNVIQQRAQKAQGDAIVHISADSIKSIEITVPEYAEQIKIAKVLYDIDTLIVNLEKLIAKKKAIKQGAMQELLTGKRRLPGFDGEWKTSKIGDFGAFVSGSCFPLAHQGRQGEKYPFYKVSDFNNPGNERYLKQANNYVSPEVADSLGCKIIPPKAIVIAKIGAAIFLERKKLTTVCCCIDNNMLAFIPFVEAAAQFICYIFQSMRFGDLTEATALPSLSGKTICAVEIAFPPTTEEQTAIATILLDMDSEIDELEKKLRKCKLIKAGMMSELLTGRIRLIDKEDA